MYSSRPRKLRRKELDQNEKLVNVQFLELDSPRPVGEHTHNGFLEKDDGTVIYLFASLVLINSTIELEVNQILNPIHFFYALERF